jgi:hypothetical protein
MTAWQYAQLVITRDGRGSEDNQTILWHGPGQGIGENLSGSGQTLLELLNRAGADGWELADHEVRQVHGDGDHYRDAQLDPDVLHVQVPGTRVAIWHPSVSRGRRSRLVSARRSSPLSSRLRLTTAAVRL